MIEAIRLDIRDVDGEWFRDVLAYVDRARGIYYFPIVSIERFADLDGPCESAWFEGDELVCEQIEMNGVAETVWSVSIGMLTTRPAK